MEELALILSYRGKCINWPKGCFNIYNGTLVSFHDLEDMTAAYRAIQNQVQGIDLSRLVIHRGDVAIKYHYKTFLKIDKDLAFQFKLGVCRYMHWNESYFEQIIES